MISLNIVDSPELFVNILVIIILFFELVFMQLLQVALVEMGDCVGMGIFIWDLKVLLMERLNTLVGVMLRSMRVDILSEVLVEV